jgi:hypothetical protein
MKLIAILLLALVIAGAYGEAVPALAVPNTIKEDNGIKEVVEIVGGVLVGAFSAHSSIKDCFDDTKGIFQDFQNAYFHLKSGGQSNVEDGLVNIGRALLKVPDAIQHCKFATDIVNKIRSVAIKFSNPTVLVVTVGKNILWHSISIYKEVKTAIAAYDHDEWFSFGMSIGVIADMVFLRNPKFRDNLNSSGSEFMNGFAHGVSPSTYDDVSKCIGDVSPATWDRLKKDINDLDWKHIERSINDIQDIGKVFVGILNDCKGGSTKVAELAAKLAAAFSTGGFIKAALKIITNPFWFEKKVEQIHKDFKANHFYAAGDDVGDFVGTALSLRTPVDMFTAESY